MMKALLECVSVQERVAGITKQAAESAERSKDKRSEKTAKRKRFR